MAAEFGALSLVPPLLAIALAVVTRKPILSLFFGVWAGGVVYTGGLGIAQTFVWITEAVGNDVFHAQLLLIVIFLGASAAFIYRLGGAIAITRFATKRLDTRRKVGVMAWVLGIIWSFGDYSNTAIVGVSMREIADEVNLPREKLAYIIDSTAAPVATFGLSSWIVYQISMIQEGYNAAGIAEAAPSAFSVFLSSIPFNIYCLLAVSMVGIVVLTRRDFGEMLDAEHRAAETGAVNREDAQPLQDIEETLGTASAERPMLRSFFLPIGALALVVGIGAGITGYAPGRSLTGFLENVDFISALVWGSFAMVATCFVLARGYDILSLDECMDTFIDGFGMMLTAISILILAWSIGTVATVLGTGTYVAAFASEFVTPMTLPLVILFIAAIVAFSTGTSWGTMAIVTPITVPLAWRIAGGSPELLGPAVGAIFSGAIFGDHCSPISDTTILSSTFTGADHIDHVRTQVYYAVTVILVTAALYFVYGAFGVTPLILVPVGVGLLVGVVYGLSEFDARRKDLTASTIGRAREPADD